MPGSTLRRTSRTGCRAAKVTCVSGAESNRINPYEIGAWMAIGVDRATRHYREFVARPSRDTDLQEEGGSGTYK